MRNRSLQAKAWGCWFTVLTALLLFLTACTPAPPATRAYQVLTTTAATVDLAMKTAGDLYRDGFISDEKKAEILEAHATYQKAARLAIAAARGAQDLQEKDIDGLINDAEKAAQAIVALVRKPQR